MCHEVNAAIVSALGPVLLFVQNLYHGISPSLRYFPLVPHQLDHPVKLPEHGRVMVYLEFEEFNREFVWSHCLCICHRPQGPDQFVFCRFDPESVCDRPLGELFDDVESEPIRFRVEKGPEEPRLHLPRTSPRSRSILPSSSRMYCEFTFRVSSMFRDLQRW